MIETIINSVALALTAFGVTTVTSITEFPLWQGYLALAAGILLEFLKYWGRSRELW